MKPVSLTSVAAGALLLATVGPSFSATLNLTANIRDFTAAHPDFQKNIANDPGILGPIGSPIGPGNKPVYQGGAGTVTTTGAANFNQWYNNPITTTINLVASDAGHPGLFTYSNSSYFPIDSLAPGGDPAGQAHNYLFTTEIHTTFSFNGAGTFSFTGDDDVWVFINGKLAIDMGGVHGAQTQSVDLAVIAAAFGLSAGNNYALSIFHAERHTTESNFRFDTTLALDNAPDPTPLPPAALLMGTVLAGGAGFGAWRRRRKTA
jgi:fibro-slime domain-containing protein/LPXTG-motif cell wall-anchored protein